MEPVCCSRCGYDQRGALAAWEALAAGGGEGATCPVNGVCSECGLVFAWGSLLNPKLRAASWLFEHVRGWRRVPLVSWRNGWSSLRSGRWWRRVQLEHSVKPWRLMVHWVVWGVALQLAFGVLSAANQAWTNYSTWLLYYGTPAPGGVVVPWTSRQTDELLQLAARVFAWPWRGQVGWSRSWGGGWFDSADFVVLLVIASAVTTASFMLLSTTMAKVRVRRVHLLRGYGHSVPVVVLLTLVWSAACWVMDAARAWHMEYYGWRDDLGTVGIPDRVVVTTLIVCLVWGMWWWRYVREYLRLPRAGWVALSLVLIGLMAGIVLARPVEGVFEWVWRGVMWAWDQMRGIVRQ